MSEGPGPAVAIYAEMPVLGTQAYSQRFESPTLGSVYPEATFSGALGGGVEVDLHRHSGGGIVFAVGVRGLVVRWDDPEPLGASELHVSLVPQLQSANPPEGGPEVVVYGGFGVGASAAFVRAGNLTAVQAGFVATVGAGAWLGPRVRIGLHAEVFGPGEGTYTAGTAADDTTWRIGWTPSRATVSIQLAWVARPSR